jgi:hypothetical protein
MNNSRSFRYSLLLIVFTAGVMFCLSSSAFSQKKYDVKMLMNEKVLFSNCVKDGSNLFVSAEELALKIDGSITIEAPYKIGPYFKFKDSKVSLIKTGSGEYSELNVKKTGILSSEVKIIILDGKKHAFIPFEEFVSAVGGTWQYNESTGIYGVTVGGCGACLIDEQ